MAQTKSQAEVWNGESGARWVANQEALDRLLAPLDQEALRRAAPRAGESVLEVGCGCGATTLALAQAVGERGRVLGVDISQPMLKRARERTAQLSQVTLRQGDAGSYAFPDPVTLIYSRFGVMFFDQPEDAFRHLRSALALGGRLCFVCWRSIDANPWYALPVRSASGVLQVPVPPPDQPGPFGLSSEERIHTLLSGAGFEDVQIHPYTTQLTMSDQGLEGAVGMATAVGGLASAMDAADAPTREAARDALREALRPHLHDGVVTLGASVFIVHAR